MSPSRGEPLAGMEGMCSPCSCAAVSLSPAQFHMQLQCKLSVALMDQSSSPQLQPQTCSHPHTSLLAHGAGHNGSSQAAPLGTSGEAEMRKAENGGGRMWKAGRGHLLFVARTHLYLCSITLNYQPPGVCSSASQHCSICPRWFGSPRGGFCHRYNWVGWGRAGGET